MTIKYHQWKSRYIRRSVQQLFLRQDSSYPPPPPPPPPFRIVPLFNVPVQTPTSIFSECFPRYLYIQFDDNSIIVPHLTKLYCDIGLRTHRCTNTYPQTVRQTYCRRNTDITDKMITSITITSPCQINNHCSIMVHHNKKTLIEIFFFFMRI